MMDFEKDMQIDQGRLDEEWLNQPGLFMRYAKLAAQAKARLDRAKENVKIIRSECIKDAKERLEKPTAQLIEADYRTRTKYIRAKEEAIDAEYSYNILDSAVFALQQRKMALENLVRLLGQEYFAAPSEPKTVGYYKKKKEEVKSKSRARSRKTKRTRTKG